jgi:hypothetical protein
MTVLVLLTLFDKPYLEILTFLLLIIANLKEFIYIGKKTYRFLSIQIKGF